MDQNNKRQEIRSNGSIDINEVLSTNKNEKKKVARKRWAILAKALKSPSGSEPSSPTDEFSVRRISSFMLLTTELLGNVNFHVTDLSVQDQIKKADYWKSQDKKYCDFCRCWITDNKPSVEFHENGRRHKENVAKRLRNIQKQSSKNQRETVKVNNALKQMELAALEAYNKDVANHADLSASTAATNKEASGKKLWQEYKSGDGRFYYQNVITNEKVLIPPIGGYTSITEHRKHVYNTGKRQIKAVQKHNLMQERVRSEIEKQEKDEETARHFREKMKERRVEDIPEPVYAPIIPSGKSTPYGHWQTVKESPITEIDLQLPQPEYEAPIVEEYVEEPAPIEFKEKVVENLGSGNVAFKNGKLV